MFDLPAEIAKELLTMPRREENVIDSIKKVNSWNTLEFSLWKVHI